MRIKKNYILYLVIIVAAIVLLANRGLIQLPLTIPPGAVLINQTVLSGEQAGSFTCDADFCTAQGTMTLNAGTPTPLAVFRIVNGATLEGGNLDVATEGVLAMKRFDYRSSGGGLPTGWIRLTLNGNYINTPSGKPIYKSSAGDILRIYYNGYPGDNHYYRYEHVSSGDGAPVNPQYSCQIRETCMTFNQYQGDFNFCPNTDPNYAYCNGAQSIQPIPPSFQGGQTYPTAEYELSRNNGITFTPINTGDGSSIQTKSITVKKYDTSTCQAAIEQGNACDNSVGNPWFKCTPQQGSEYKANEQCYGDAFWSNPTVHCTDGSDPHRRNGVECGSQLSKPWCYSETLYTPYVKCTNTKLINGVPCGDWSNQTFFAPSGQECFLIIGGQISDQHGPGAAYQPGGLKCPSYDSCNLGDKRGTDGSPTYEECVIADACHNVWQSKTCTSPLLWNTGADSCICPTLNQCENPSQKQCTGSTTYIPCSAIGQGCYAWTSQQSCTGEFMCENLDGNYDNCNCNPQGANKCDEGTIECLSNTTYKRCEIQNPTSECRDYRGVYTVENPYLFKCENNLIVPRGDVGCSYPDNPESELCGTAVDSRSILLEHCSSNLCEQTQDQWTAQPTDTVKCLGNTVYYGKKYTFTRSKGTSVDVYRWEIKTDAPGSNNGVCTQGLVCSQGECRSQNQYFTIVVNASYGVTESLGLVKIIVYPLVPDNQNIRVTGFLFEPGTDYNGACGSGCTSTTILASPQGPNGYAELNFQGSLSKIGNYTLKVALGDTPLNTSFNDYRQIRVAKKVIVSISCNPLGSIIVGREALCSYLFKDALQPSQSVDVQTYTTTLTQNGVPIGYVNRGDQIAGIKFTPTSRDSITLTVNALPRSSDYLPSVGTATYQVQDTQRTTVIKLDNQDFSYYAGSIASGTHSLSFFLTESGEALPVNRYEIKIKNAQQTDTEATTLEVDSSGSTSYNFGEAGKTYTIFGGIYLTDGTFWDIGRTQISTLQTNACSGFIDCYFPYIVIGIGVLLFVIVLSLAFAFRNKSKRRR